MNTKEFLKSIETTYANALQIVVSKNQDYATEADPFKNFRSAEVVGVSPNRAILVRVLDKLSRISNLLDKENSVKDESVSDSISDAINYLAILKASIENE